MQPLVSLTVILKMLNRLAAFARTSTVAGPSIWNGLPLSIRSLPRTFSEAFLSQFEVVLFGRAGIGNLCKSYFYYTRAIRHIRLVLTKNLSQIIACSRVSSRLDYVIAFCWSI